MLTDMKWVRLFSIKVLIIMEKLKNTHTENKTTKKIHCKSKQSVIFLKWLLLFMLVGNVLFNELHSEK